MAQLDHACLTLQNENNLCECRELKNRSVEGLYNLQGGHVTGVECCDSHHKIVKGDNTEKNSRASMFCIFERPCAICRLSNINARRYFGGQKPRTSSFRHSLARNIDDIKKRIGHVDGNMFVWMGEILG